MVSVPWSLTEILLLHSVFFFLPVLAFFLPSFLVVPVLFRLMKPCELCDLTLEWFESFQPSSYQPMQGLLAQDDFQFLSRQPGFDPALSRKLRLDRLRIFRQYLNRLIVDFNRLHTLARLVVSQSTEDQSDVFARLVSLRFRFWGAVLRVEFSYLMCRFGLRPIAVDELIRHLEAVKSQLSLLPQSKALLA